MADESRDPIAAALTRDAADARTSMDGGSELSADPGVVLARVAAIVESSDDAIVGKTLDGIITSWNGGAEQLYGYTASEVVGTSISVLVPSDQPDDLPEMLKLVRKGRGVDRFETERVRKNGQR